MYKVETHAHTAEVSRCGHLNGDELARMYSDAGYNTLFITDHFYRSYFDSLGDMCWKDKLREYKTGVENARLAGEKRNLTVLFGVELRLNCCDNDYLIYGLADSVFEAHADIFDMNLTDMSRMVRANGGLIIQAHPTRKPKSNPTPEIVDGFEIYNTNPRHADSTDVERGIYLSEQYHLLQTGGSDAHREEDVALGGVEFPCDIDTADAYIRALKQGRGRAIPL